MPEFSQEELADIRKKAQQTDEMLDENSKKSSKKSKKSKKSKNKSGDSLGSKLVAPALLIATIAVSLLLMWVSG
jgi:hypothetical protein